MGDSPHILLVDDDETRRELLAIVLATTTDGVRVEPADDAVALGVALNDASPNAVVAAHPCAWLPGTTLLERLRGALPDTPLLLLAEEPSEELIRRALQLGVDDFVRSDAGAPLRLRDALRRLLRRAPAASQPQPEHSGDRRAPATTAEPDAPTLPGAVQPTPAAPPARRRTALGPPTGPPPDRAPSKPQAPAPAEPPSRPQTPTPAEAPTATMRALVRKGAPEAADEPTEVAGPGLDLLLDEAGLGWFRCRLDGALLDANQAFLALVGTEDVSAAQRQLPRLGFGEARWSDFVARVRDQGQLVESRLEFRTLADERRFVNLTLRGASAGRDQPVIDGIVVDQTEVERLWERLGELRAGEASGPAPGVITLDHHRRRRPVAKALEPVGLATDKERLRARGCDLGQGYFFSQPVDLAAARGMVGASFGSIQAIQV